jgi:hypothetical protein
LALTLFAAYVVAKAVIRDGVKEGMLLAFKERDKQAASRSKA